jgi:hypothetical protein
MNRQTWSPADVLQGISFEVTLLAIIYKVNGDTKNEIG